MPQADRFKEGRFGGRQASPSAIFFRVLGIIAAGEFLIMCLLGLTGIPRGVGENVLDAVLLPLVAAPFLYRWVVRPMASRLSQQEELTRTARDQESSLKEFAAMLDDSEKAEKQALGQSRRVELLNRIASSVLRGTDIDMILRQAAGDFCAYMQASRCAFLLFGENDRLIEHCAPGFPATGISFRLGLSPRETAASDKACGNRIVRDIAETLLPPERKAEAARMRLGACLAVPMLGHQDLIGILFVDSGEPRPWTDHETGTAEVVAREVAVAVHHDRAIRDRREIAGRLLSLMNNVPGMVYRGNRNWTLAFVGADVEKITGFTAEEALHLDWRDLIHPDDMERVRNAFREAVRTRTRLLHVEYRTRHKAGGYRWTADRRQFVYDEDGAFAYVDGLYLDITAQKEIEEDLIAETRRVEEARQELLRQHDELNRLYRVVAHAKREWETTMDCIADMVLLTDRDGRILRCNQAFARFARKSYPDIVGKARGEILGACGIDVPVLVGAPQEIRHEAAGRWFIVNQYPYANGGPAETAGIVVTVHDSTAMKAIGEDLARKHAELNAAYSELKASHSKLLQQEKMASIGQLAAGVAHEINNPMGFISSNLGTLRKYADRMGDFIRLQSECLDKGVTRDTALLQAKRKELKIDHIMSDIGDLIGESAEGAERIRCIVQDLKTFSRVDEADVKPADINECLSSTINIAWNELKYKATLTRDFGDIPRTKCHPRQLNQVFLNLLLNASHAIEKGGVIAVKTRAEDGFITVSVSDTGCGIPPENLGRIFEPFYTTKEVGKGTGLGLSIAYDIVKKHGGEITVASEPAKGTTFDVRIPIVA